MIVSCLIKYLVTWELIAIPVIKSSAELILKQKHVRIIGKAGGVKAHCDKKSSFNAIFCVMLYLTSNINAVFG